MLWDKLTGTPPRLAPTLRRDPRRAYRVVDDFEAELCAFTGAPHAVAVDSCTNALLLALTYERLLLGETGLKPALTLPKRTYVGVLQAARNAGWWVEWSDEPWTNCYALKPTRVVDSARYLARGMYEPDVRHLVALSFHSGKQLALGRGGAILTDDAKAAEWFRAARMDGRPPGAPIEATIFPGYHVPMPQEHAALGLSILSKWNDRGQSPDPLPPEEYPDLSQIESLQSGPATRERPGP